MESATKGKEYDWKEQSVFWKVGNTQGRIKKWWRATWWESKALNRDKNFKNRKTTIEDEKGKKKRKSAIEKRKIQYERKSCTDWKQIIK